MAQIGLTEFRDRAVETVEAVAQVGGAGKPGFGHGEAAALARHQAAVEASFEAAHQLLHGGRRHLQLLGGLAIAEVARDRLEGPKRVEGGQPIAHDRS